MKTFRWIIALENERKKEYATLTGTTTMYVPVLLFRYKYFTQVQLTRKNDIILYGTVLLILF